MRMTGCTQQKEKKAGVVDRNRISQAYIPDRHLTTIKSFLSLQNIDMQLR
jgi:hypothetical protein